MYDIAIVGAGPAGLSAAIYAQRAGKKTVLFEAYTYGGQIINTPKIENYPGIKDISGFDYATGLFDQALSFGAEIVFEQVTAVNKSDCFVITTTAGTYEAQAVIIATGAKNRHLGLEKEEALTGRGISYCATCDGAFFKGKNVAVNGGGNTAIEDATFLSGYCSKVYVIHRREGFRAEEGSLQALREKDNVEFVLNATITDLIGEDKLSAVVVTDKLSGQTREIAVDGLFIAIGQVPDNAVFSEIAELDQSGYVLSGEDCTTRTPGLFTAGDCRAKHVRQLVTAASDGAVAALAACSYIDKL